MSQMDEVLVLDGGEPVRTYRRLRRIGQALYAVQKFKKLGDGSCLARAKRVDGGSEIARLVGAIEETKKFADRLRGGSIEPERCGLPGHGVEDTQSRVAHRSGLVGIDRIVPLKRAVRFSTATDMCAQLRARSHHFRVGVFKHGAAGRIVQRCAMGEDIADDRVHSALHDAMNFMQADKDVGIHTADERKRAWGLGAFELNPCPRQQAEILIPSPCVPDSGHM